MTTLLDTTITKVRRGRRAYLGALGLSYEFALKRAELRIDQAQALFGDLVQRGETIEAGAAQLMGRAKAEAEDVIDGAKAKLASAKPAAKPAAKTTVKTKTAKPSSKKRTVTLKTTDAPATAKAVAKAPKGKSLDDMSEALQAHVERVQTYDPMANPAMVAKIVTHLGIALKNRDTRFVACTDEAERKTVAESWLVKKLGVEGDAAALDAKVGAVCTLMKADRLKDRVTFYYLVAKNEGKLGEL